MNIKKTMNDKICTLAVKGDIDTITSPVLEKEISENAPQCQKMILDLAGVEYISSAGIRTVLKARQLMGKENLVLKNMNKNLMEIFKLTGFLGSLNIE